MKKIGLFIVLLFVVTLFVGCANIDMQYKLDTDNTLEIRYSISFDKSKGEFDTHNISKIRMAIVDQWEMQGLEVDWDERDDELVFTGVLKISHDTRQQAFDSLDKILKSEYSPFTNTGLSYASSYLEDEYNLSANISLKDLIRRNEYKIVPTDIQNELIEHANESNFSLTIALPGEAESTNADSEDYSGYVTTSTWNLKYGDEKEIAMRTIIKNQQNIDYYNELTRTTNLNQLIFIGCGAAALLLIIIFLILFFRKRAQR